MDVVRENEEGSNRRFIMSSALPWVKYENNEKNSGVFTASPLVKGMGTTVGNSLRRVLLSSLEGWAITSVKIDNVDHEFMSVPNVVEDALDIISNLKQLVFTSSTDGDKQLKLSVSKKGKILGKDIELPGDVELLNHDAYIAELSTKGSLTMEINLKKGVGYKPSENHSENSTKDINTIFVDSSFSPILRVNHNVENTRVGKNLDYEILNLEVETNGSVTPEEAVKKAVDIIVGKFELFNDLNNKPTEEVSEDQLTAEQTEMQQALSLTVDDLELSARSSNCLKRAGIESVKELIEKDYSELIQIKNFGKKSATEINEKLSQYKLSLKEV